MTETETAIQDYTDVQQVRAFLCALCGNSSIIEKRTAKIPNRSGKSANFPDEEIFDQTIYANFVVTGGKLFKDRPNIPWETDEELFWEEKGEIPIGVLHFNVKLEHGGLCIECLKRDAAEHFIARIENH